MPIYEYRQNNTGGTFVNNEQVSICVLIVADNVWEANHIADTIGIYFNGVQAGRDCACCGDRWSDPHEHKTTLEELLAEKRDDYGYSFYKGLSVQIYDHDKKVNQIPCQTSSP